MVKLSKVFDIYIMPKDPTSWNGVYLSALYGPCRYPGFQEFCGQLRAAGITQNMQQKAHIVKRFAGTPQWQEYHQWVVQVYPAARSFGTPPPQKVTAGTTAPVISSTLEPSRTSGFIGDDMISQGPSVPRLPTSVSVATAATAGKAPSNWNGVYLSKLVGVCQYPGFKDYCAQLSAAGVAGNMQQKGHIVKRFSGTPEWQKYHEWVIQVYPAARAFGAPPPQKVTGAVVPSVPTGPVRPTAPRLGEDLILQTTPVRRQTVTKPRQPSPTRRGEKTLKQRQRGAREEQLPPSPRYYAPPPPVPRGARALSESEKKEGVVRGKRTLPSSTRRPQQLPQQGEDVRPRTTQRRPAPPAAPRLSQIFQAARRPRAGQQSQDSDVPEGF